MTDHRLKPQDLTPLNSSPFMTMHGARVTYPIADAIASPEFFLTVRSNLRSGDTVRLCRYASGDWTKARLVEYGEVMITQCTPKAVEFELMGEIRVVGAAKPELEPAKRQDELAELEIVDNPQGGFIVREVASGHVHKHFKSRIAADRYVADYGGQPKAEAA